MKPVFFLLLLLFAAVVTPAAALDTSGAVQRCQQILPGFEKDLASVTIGVQASELEAPVGVRIDYRTMDGRDGYILCWFLGRQSESDAWQMDQLESSKYGVMRRYEIQQLYKLLYLETKPLPPALEVQRDWRRLLLYFLQQTINAISLGCVYGLLALGFTLVFSVTRTINFAFGEFYMLGAFLLYIGHVVAFWLWGDTAPATLLIFLFLVTATGAGYSWLLDKSVFRPLRSASPTVPLIAAIGAAIVLREGVRLLQGAKTRYLLIEELDSWPILSGAGFDVYLSKGHLIVAISTVIIAVALWWVLRKTNYGRKQRAIAQDPFAAQLMGVDNNKVIALTFILGGALATAGGFFAGAQYGVINFHMGTVVGFKALTAALLGGIGSAPGALLGGLVLALVETYCTAYLGAGWEDVVVFGVLVAVLVFFPHGVLGQGPEKRLAGQGGLG